MDGESGFTLVEVLVALTVFAVVSAALAGALVGLGRMHADAWRLTQALMMIRTEVSLPRAACPDSLDAEWEIELSAARVGRRPLTDTLPRTIHCR